MAGASSAAAQVTTTYSYDGQGQVTQVTRSAGTTAYSYDAAGNRIGLSVTSNAPAVSNTTLTSTYNGSGSVTLPVSGTYTSVWVQPAAAHGTVTLSGLTATYVPTSGYSGSDSFTYNATGPGGTSATATVSVSVASPPVAASPTPQPDSANVHSRATVVISPLANDTDPSSYPLTITAVSSNGGGTPTIITNGTQINYLAPTVATRANKTVTLTYTVSNGHGGTASSTVTVVVETEYYD